MLGMEVWEWGLWGGAAYVAVVSLVRLMRHRRGVVMQELQQQVLQERQQSRRRSKVASGEAALNPPTRSNARRDVA